MQHKVYTRLVKTKGDRGLGGTLWNRPVNFPAPLVPPRVPTPPCESVPFKYYLPCAGRERERLVIGNEGWIPNIKF